MRRITNRRLAQAYRCTDHYVSRVLNGYEEPSAGFRSFLAAFLDVPEADLFRFDDRRAGAA